MSAPLLWIVLPIALGGFLLFFRDERFLARMSAASALALGLLALVVPIDAALLLG
ncbi:MAG: hypothetical protein IT296_01130, partial [Anaerolineae bacterium]|nr:hypothetical protein [Anaerolineae bacterium]